MNKEIPFKNKLLIIFISAMLLKANSIAGMRFLIDNNYMEMALMQVYNFKHYQLILSDNPCDIFKHFGVDELHGLSLQDCEAYNNTKEDAYIAGLCNLIPNTDKMFIFLNTSRMNNCKEKMALIFHEAMHLSLEIHNHDVNEKEEEIISWAESEAIKIFDLI